MTFKSHVHHTFDEWRTTGTCSAAVTLNTHIGEDYFDTTSPHFFTGDIHSAFVLVHLNPGRAKELWGSPCAYSDFDAYWDRFARWGYHGYGNSAGKGYIPTGKFDAKQYRFMLAFGFFPFVGDKSASDMEMSIDRKLQLELVPFGSPKFEPTRIGVDNLRPFVAPALNLLLEAERKYIIFCGRVFVELLKDYIVAEKRHAFHLVKKDGSLTKLMFEAINVKLKYNNREIIACIAPQYPMQGIPADKYGEKVREVYGRF